MNEDRLPENFDVLIIGTGVTESIVSAAVSRNGHSVLHLDPRDYYGGVWATLNFDAWLSGEFTRSPQQVVSSVDKDNSCISWTNSCKEFEDVWYCEDDGVKDELKKQCRRFNIDVCPKVVLAREEVIELLIKSNVSRYLEFLRVGKLFTNLPHPCKNVIESIPLSRSDIFTSKSISLVEKRTLVKFIEAILKPVEDKTPDECKSSDTNETQNTVALDELPTFEELAKSSKLSEKVKHLIRAAVQTLEDGFDAEGTTDDVFNLTFVNRCKNFLQSIGRFGNQTPYLWTLYGISEICQAFCRLSAVYGGLFILKRHISSLEEIGEEIRVKSESDDFKIKFVVLGSEMKYFKSPEYRTHSKVCKTVCRGVLVTTGGTITSEVTKPGTRNDGIYFYKIEDLEIVEMNHSSQAVPKDYRLLQVSSPFNITPENSVTPRQKIEATLGPFLNFTEPENVNEPAEVDESEPKSSPPNPLMPEEISTRSNLKPRVVYGSYFLIDIFEEDDQLFRSKKGTYDPSENMGGKVLSCATGTSDINAQVEKAKEIFLRMFPDEEFLPKAPDMTEDIEENGFVEDHNIEPIVAPEEDANAGAQEANDAQPIENDNSDDNANE